MSGPRRASLAIALSLLALAPAPAAVRAFTIAAAFDTSITNQPQAATIEATINSAIAVYQNAIVDPVTATITFRAMSTGLGHSNWNGYIVPYSNFLADLRNHASSLDDAAALSHLPDGPANPVDGNDSIVVETPLARALGLVSAPQTSPDRTYPMVNVSVANPSPGDPRTRPFDPVAARRALQDVVRIMPTSVLATTDGVIGLNLSIMNFTTTTTDPTKYSLFSVACHEIDEVIGFSSALNGRANGSAAPTGPIGTEDLFRYQANGARSFTTVLDSVAYFSIDGTTDLARFNQYDQGDFADWNSPPVGSVPPEVQDAFQTPGVNPVPAVELRVLDVIGYSFGPPGVWVAFTYGGPFQTGGYATPYATLTQGVAAVPTGGTILIKGNATSPEKPSITRAMSITTVGGPVIVGQ